MGPWLRPLGRSQSPSAGVPGDRSLLSGHAARFLTFHSDSSTSAPAGHWRPGHRYRWPAAKPALSLGSGHRGM